MRFRTNANPKKPPGLPAKLGGSLFFGVFLAAGLFFAGLLFLHVKQIAGTYRWDKIPCFILSSEADVDEKADSEKDRYFVRIRYRYEIDGRALESDRVTSSPRSYDTFDKASAVAARFPPDSRAVCHVDPANPGTAILVRDSLGQALFLLLPLVFIAVGGGGIYSMWSRPRTPATGGTVKSTAPPRQVGAWFGWIFVAVGGVLFYFLTLGPITNLIAARSWDEVPCRILSSRVQTHDGDDGDTYSVDILYSYQVNGQIYRSSRYRFLGGSSSGYAGKRDIVERYGPGTTHTCFVDPAHPEKAVLDRSAGWILLLGLIPLVFLGVGLAVVVASRKSAGPPPTRAPIASGPTSLEPKTSRLVRFFGTLGVAIFWNGIVSVFAHNLWSDYTHGRLSVFEALFLSPFLLIGAGLIVFTGIAFLQLFNARVTLELDRPLRLGDATELRWTFRGQTHNLRRLRIELVGLEQASYRQGTSTRTARREFFRQALVQADDSRAFVTGRIEVPVPGDTVSSFDFGSNRIVWELRLRGVVQWWPDVDEAFVVPVLPAAPRADAILPPMTL